jgi:hypothetical protein
MDRSSEDRHRVGIFHRSRGKSRREIGRIGCRRVSVWRFPAFDAAGGKDTAQQALAAELGHPVTPGLGSNAQPLEDSGQLRRDRGLPLPKEPAGVFDKLEFGYRHRLPRFVPRRKEPSQTMDDLKIGPILAQLWDQAAGARAGGGAFRHPSSRRSQAPIFPGTFKLSVAQLPELARINDEFMGVWIPMGAWIPVPFLLAVTRQNRGAGS